MIYSLRPKNYLMLLSILSGSRMAISFCSKAYGDNDSVLLSPLNEPDMRRKHPSFFAIDGLESVNTADSKHPEVFKATYHGNSIGSQRMVYSFELNSTNLKKASLSFNVRFCDGFDFAKGGKLHGLGSLFPASGGYLSGDDSWSARVVFFSGGGIGSYIYHQHQKGVFGDWMPGKNFKFQPGKWYRISLTVELNDPGFANGSAIVSVDSLPVISHVGLMYRSRLSSSSYIRKFLFSTFYGGHSAEYAPKNVDGSFRSTCAFFDDFTVRP